jgi:LysM repeat protein
MRRYLIVCILVCISVVGKAQESTLKIHGTAPDLYLSHKVVAKENYYSIGRLYNVSPKSIAPFNNLDFEKPLTPGQQIKIPLTSSNFLQDGKASNGEVTIPLYHTVEPKEGLYRISLKYNKVPIDVIKKLNGLKGDAVNNGTNLIVGYLKVLEDQSPLAKVGSKSSPNTSTDVAKDEKPVSTPQTSENSGSDVNVPKETYTTTSNNTSEKSVKSETTNDVRSLAKYTSNTESGKPSSINYNGGVFRKIFETLGETNASTEKGIAGVFKSTSGWHDGKYYCLHNTARPETVIKVTNPATGKSIYAKVVDMIPDIRQNNGTVILISNAAAEELGAAEGKFNVNLSYTNK